MISDQCKDPAETTDAEGLGQMHRVGARSLQSSLNKEAASIEGTRK